MSLLGRTVLSEMAVAMSFDDANRRMTAELTQGNFLMKAMDSSFEVYPLGAEAAAALLGRKEEGGMPRAALAAALAGGAGLRPGAASVVVMRQRASPRVAPPPPFAGLLRGHLGGVFSQMMQELQVAAGEAVAPPARARAPADLPPAAMLMAPA